jgi:subfamily B ATP-binding cassette protein MsbA
MKTFWRILSYSRPYSAYFPQYVVLAILIVFFGVFNFSLLIPLLNVLFGNVKVPEVLVDPEFSLSINFVVAKFNFYMYSLIRNQGLEYALYFICGIIFLFICLSNLFKYLAQRVITRMRVVLMKNLRSDIFLKYSKLSIGYLNTQKKGNLLTVISNDINDIEYSILTSLEAIFREPFLITGYFIFLFTISPELTFFTILYLPISGLIINQITRRLKSGDGLRLMSNIVSLTEETLSGLRIIKIFNAEKFIRNKFDEVNNNFTNYLKNWLNKREMASPASEILGVLSAIGIILYGGHLVINKSSNLDASQFITYIIIFSQILGPAKAISNSFATGQRGVAAGKRIFEILDIDDQIKEIENPKHKSEIQSSIQFDKVSFSYGQNPVLKDISFSASKGKSLALVGPSGGGKSTILDLLVRFYDADSGAITIDGDDVKMLKVSDLRGLFGMVNQDTILFNDTIFNNIAFGKTDATQEMVERAAKIANAHSFIVQSEKGYQTEIGDRGSKLSGGQRQRLSIARAVLRNPQILLLDEATSALDTESEKLVQDAISNLMIGRTSIVIAHRLSTIQNADQILVLDKGKIVESGTHESLYTQNGLYRKLVDLQSF